jgi:flagellar assembly protein FliH
MRTHNKFISEEDITAVAGWSFGAVDPNSVRFAEKLKAQSRAEHRHKEDAEQERINAIRQSGFTKGYEEGFAQGHAQATLEGQRHIAEYMQNEGLQASQKFLQLFSAAQQQLADSEQAIAQGVLELACEIARQIVRREITVNLDAVTPVIHESMGQLLGDGKSVAVRLHPLDVEQLGAETQEKFAQISLNLVADAAIERGGCLVDSEGAVIDGTLQRRWERTVASLGLSAKWEPDREPR